MLFTFVNKFFMLKKVLEFLEELLEGAVEPGADSSIALSSIVNAKGEYVPGDGKMALALVNVEEERFLKAQLQRQRVNGEQVQLANPEIKLNLLIMLAANPGANNYGGALDRLSEAITFFQGTSFFDKANYPQLGPDIDQLSVELYSLTIDQQNQLWASLGAKYLPSVVYKVRMVVVDEGNFGKPKPVIRSIDNNLNRIN